MRESGATAAGEEGEGIGEGEEDKALGILDALNHKYAFIISSFYQFCGIVLVSGPRICSALTAKETLFPVTGKRVLLAVRATQL